MRYDITKTFEYNKENGPFERIRDRNAEIKKILGTYGITADFFGFKTKLPLGVAAGPLYNKRYMAGALKDGFAIATWKTFRSVDRLAHRNDGSYLGHNIVYLPGVDLTKEDMGKKVPGSLNPTTAPEDVSITNSFGMPSAAPAAWLPDIIELEKYAKEHNKQIIASVVGTPKEKGTIEELAADYAFVARCAESVGSNIIEINLSCPNVHGAEGSIYKDPRNTAIIARAVREHFYNPDTKLLIKVGYASEAYYKKLLRACGKYIDSVVAINTIPMHIVDKKGKQALPGGKTSGTCGKAILPLATKAVGNLVRARKALGKEAKHVKIVGCGGVTNAEGFMAHIDAGAEFVMCATAALFNPDLPVQVARYIRDNKIKKKI
jgi:dihydroorotate dehydrogenase